MVAMNGSIASANNATLHTVAANYGLKTVVDQHSLDIAARITPLEVDTKVANAVASRDASISGLQASKADASALTAYALQSWTRRSRPLSWTQSPRQPLTQPSQHAGRLALHGGRLGHAAGRRYEDCKCLAGSRHRGLRRS